MEWINTAWAWVENNITPFLTAANLAAVLSIIVTLVRQKTAIRDNTSSSKELRQTLNESRGQGREIAEIKAQVGALGEFKDESIIKSNALLEILYAVYMGQGAVSETTKKKIDVLFTQARYTGTQTRAELLRTLEEMKNDKAKEAENLKKNAEKIKKIVGATEPVEGNLINFGNLKKG